MVNKYIYDIVAWDPINTSGQNIMAMVYIKPDLKLLTLFQRAPMNNILNRVTGTDSKVYDNKIVFGTIDKSSDIPSYRQNLFNCDGLYCVTLDHLWGGYPVKNGKIEFLNETVDMLIADYSSNQTPEETTKINNSPFKLSDSDDATNPNNNNNSNSDKNTNTNWKTIIYTVMFIIVCLIIIKIVI
jgi:hypothetical protein